MDPDSSQQRPLLPGVDHLPQLGQDLIRDRKQFVGRFHPKALRLRTTKLRGGGDRSDNDPQKAYMPLPSPAAPGSFPLLPWGSFTLGGTGVTLSERTV